MSQRKTQSQNDIWSAIKKIASVILAAEVVRNAFSKNQKNNNK